jgi:predicted Zn finger-like uncharacterized protein
MANTFVIACPDCAKQVKVGEEHIGKKVRCKGCGQVFPIQEPKAAGSPKPKAAAATKGKAPPPPPKAKAAAASKAPPLPAPEPDPTLDPDYDPNKYTMGETNDTLPRCPFCANEMASADARICLHCGYNTRTRNRPEVKAVYAHSGMDMFLWLLPGILCILTMIGLLVWYIFFYGLIEGWLDDSWFEDEKGPPKVYIAAASPGMFRLYHALLIAALYVPLTRFAYKRLVVNNRPQEQKIKED